MTEQEKSQPLSTFEEAGKKAYHAGIHISGNPYKEQPYRQLWDKGYKQAKRAFEGKRPENKRPPFKQEGDQGYERKHRHPKPNERRQKRNEPQPQNQYNTDKLFDRFNKRHRTAI